MTPRLQESSKDIWHEKELKINKMRVVYSSESIERVLSWYVTCVYNYKLCLHRKPLELFLVSSANLVRFSYGDLLKAATQINNKVQN